MYKNYCVERFLGKFIVIILLDAMIDILLMKLFVYTRKLFVYNFIQL